MAKKYVDQVALQQNIVETKARLDNKVDKVTGKGLSSNDYTNDEKTKLAGIAEGAQVNTLEGIKVNASVLPISGKYTELGKMALKDEVAETDLASALSTKINGKADSSSVYSKSDVNTMLSSYAPIASPAFTGTPTAPKAAKGTNTGQVATTSFVKEATDDIKTELGSVFKFKGVVADMAALEAITDPSNGDVYQVTNAGTGKTNAEYVWNNTAWIELGTEVDLSGYAPVNSPAFTGTPTAPTASKGTSGSVIATAGFVQNELADYEKSADLVAITAAEVTALWSSIAPMG